MSLARFLWHLPRNLASGLIFLYQKTLSPDHSWLGKRLLPFGHCKYRPSCSEYARFALQKNGFIHGLAQAAWRILRCNPWSQGGDDLPR